MAAKQADADAIHPGYGFLSENAAFVRRCEAAGLIFVGPSAQRGGADGIEDRVEAHRRGGRRADRARLCRRRAGSRQRLPQAARRIGFPVLIKASAGGGGRGMRRVDRAEDFADRAGAREGRGRGRLRRRRDPAGKIHSQSASSRSADRRRPCRQSRSFVRARLFGPAQQSESCWKRRRHRICPDRVRGRLSMRPCGSAAPSATTPSARSNSSWSGAATSPISSR